MENKSSTLAVLKHAAVKLKELGADVYVTDIRTLDLPLFSYKALLSMKNLKFTELVKKIKDADGFIFA